MGRTIKLLILGIALLIIPFLATSCVPDPFTGFGFLWAPFSLVGLAIYLLPTIIALVRHAKSSLGIILVNILAGWTFVGWIIALVWSLTSPSQKIT